MTDSDIQLKLGRARTHIDEFRTKAAGIRDGYCVIRPEDDEERQMTVMRISITPKAPDELRLIAGDALFNMRAALDYIVTQAVLANPPHTPSRANQFPIAQDGKSFRAIEGRQLAGVPDTVRAILEKFQPYHPGNEPLTVLSKLHNPDKHRSLNLTAVVADSSHLVALGGANPFALVSDIPFCDGGISGTSVSLGTSRKNSPRFEPAPKTPASKASARSLWASPISLILKKKRRGMRAPTLRWRTFCIT